MTIEITTDEARRLLRALDDGSLANLTGDEINALLELEDKLAKVAGSAP